MRTSAESSITIFSPRCLNDLTLTGFTDDASGREVLSLAIPPIEYLVPAPRMSCMSLLVRGRLFVRNVPQVKVIGPVEAGGKQIFGKGFLPRRARDASESREMNGDRYLIEESHRAAMFY